MDNAELIKLLNGRILNRLEILNSAISWTGTDLKVLKEKVNGGIVEVGPARFMPTFDITFLKNIDLVHDMLTRLNELMQLREQMNIETDN